MNILILAGSLLEMMIVFHIHKVLGFNCKLGKASAIVIIAVTAFVTTIFDYYKIPYQLSMTCISYIVATMIFVQRNVCNIIIDSVAAFIVLFILELPIVLITKVGIVTEYETGLQYTILIIIIIGVIWTEKNTMIRELCGKYYQKNRKVIMMIAMNMMMLCCIIVNFYNKKTYFFEGHYAEFMLLAAGYILIHILYFFSAYSDAQKKKELQLITEYQTHLNAVTERLNHRQHEYKNELNTILGIAERKEGNKTLEQIIQYTKQIYDQKKEASCVSVICDQSIVAALIYRMHKIAEERQISFSYYLEEPFPKYEITENELTEILSNLLNNGFEAVESLPVECRQVSIQITEKEIEVTNSVEHSFKDKDIMWIGRKKYSTKGEGHGYGMANVFRLLRKNEIGMTVYLDDNLHFVLHFPEN